MGKQPQPRDLYASEADLCDQLIACARARGFQVFPETNDFDLLLVAGIGCTVLRAGDQVGVQAKLRANFHVLAQALPRDRGPTPHHHAVLVPEADIHFRQVARAARISVLRAAAYDRYYTGFSRRDDLLERTRWYRSEPKLACWVPECELPEMRGGRFGPKKITPWKMNAVKLCVLAMQRGYLTSLDFKAAKVDIQRFVKEGWIEAFDKMRVEGSKRAVQRYMLRQETRPPHLLYPDVVEALAKAGLV